MTPEEYAHQRERRMYLSEHPLADTEDVDLEPDDEHRQAELTEVTAE